MECQPSLLDEEHARALARECRCATHPSRHRKPGTVSACVKRTVLALVSFGLAFASAVHAQTEPFPSRAVRIVVPFPPGSTVDILARTIGQSFSEELGQPFVIDNRPGASGNIGMAFVAKSAPDGYTLLVASVNLVVNPALYSSVGYDPEKDFAPISMIATTANVLVVNPGVRASSVKELIALAKESPGKLNYGSSGVGTTLHLSGELFNRMADVKIVHVPYKGPVEMLTDVVAGRVDLTFANMSSALRLAQSGKLKPLAVTSAHRHPSLPDVPTIAEQGLTGYEAIAWFGLLAPGGTPRPIIEKLNSHLVATLKTDAVRERLSKAGIDALSTTPEQFAAQLKSEAAKWTELVRLSGAKLD